MNLFTKDFGLLQSLLGSEERGCRVCGRAFGDDDSCAIIVTNKVK